MKTNEKPKLTEWEPIIYGCLNGDKLSEVELYKKSYNFVHHSIVSTLNGCSNKKLAEEFNFRVAYSLEDIDDIIIEVFFKIFRGLNTLKIKNGYILWARKICISTTMDWMKKAIRREKIARMSFSIDEADSEGNRKIKGRDISYLDLISAEKFQGSFPICAVVERNEIGFIVNDILNRLSEPQKICLIHWMNNLSYSDISALTGINENTVKTNIRRAKDNVLEIIESLNESDKETLYDYCSNIPTSRILLSEITDTYDKLREKLNSDNTTLNSFTAKSSETLSVSFNPRNNRLMILLVSGTAFLLIIAALIWCLTSLNPKKEVEAVEVLLNELTIRHKMAQNLMVEYLNEHPGTVRADLKDTDSYPEIKSETEYKIKDNTEAVFIFRKTTDTDYYAEIKPSAYDDDYNKKVFAKYYDSNKKRISSYDMKAGETFYVAIVNSGKNNITIKLTEAPRSGSGWYFDDNGTLWLTDNQPDLSFSFDKRVKDIRIAGDVSEISEGMFADDENLGNGYSDNDYYLDFKSAYADVLMQLFEKDGLFKGDESDNVYDASTNKVVYTSDEYDKILQMYPPENYTDEISESIENWQPTKAQIERYCKKISETEEFRDIMTNMILMWK